MWWFALLSVYIRDIEITTVKNFNYRCIIHNISKSEAINLLENPVLKECCLEFSVGVFLLFLFSIYKMIHSMDTYKSLNINIETSRNEKSRNAKTCPWSPQN